MKLLGTYQSNLTQLYYNQLLDLVNLAIYSGDYSGGYTFDASQLTALVASGNLFQQLAIPTAGLRAIDEDFNNPVTLLVARYTALAGALSSLQTNIDILVNVLVKDTALLSQLIESVKAQALFRNEGSVFGSTSFVWSFGTGLGPVTNVFPTTDPSTGVLYTNLASIQTTFDTSTGITLTGLVPAFNLLQNVPKDLEWVYDSVGFEEVLYGDNWAELDFLETQIQLNFNDPEIQVVLPDSAISSPFSVTGDSSLLGIPVYVKTLFHPRADSTILYAQSLAVPTGTSFPVSPGQIYYVQAPVTSAGADGSCTAFLNYLDSNGNTINTSTGTPVATAISNLNATGIVSSSITIPSMSNITAAVIVLVENAVTTGSYNLGDGTVQSPISLSAGYSIDPTSVNIFTGTQYYNLYTDYIVGANGNVTLITIPDNTAIVVSYTINYPAYQCSIDQINWSPIIMFDNTRPYADDETEFLPIPMGVDNLGNRTLLPIVDESNQATGLYIALNTYMPNEFLLKVYQDADNSTCGKPAILNIDLTQVSYTDKLCIAPYTTFPITVTSITVQGFTSADQETVFSGSFVLDKPTVFKFPKKLIGSISISTLQQNYTIKQHQILPDDYLRREALNDLQSIVPIRAQDKYILPAPSFVNGYQYTFGVENISASNDDGQLPVVFVAGAYTFIGNPQVINFDANMTQGVEAYLCFVAKDANGIQLSIESSGIPLTNNASSIVDLNTNATVASVDFGIKFVLRSSDSCVESFRLQVL